MKKETSGNGQTLGDCCGVWVERLKISKNHTIFLVCSILAQDYFMPSKTEAEQIIKKLAVKQLGV